MQQVESKVAEHYAVQGLDAVIEDGWAKLRNGSDAAPVDQLAGVDEFHMGGRGATEMVCDRLGLAPGLRVADIGCGLGGAARFMADRYGAQVEGIDLTENYVAIGNRLSKEVGLEGAVSLHHGSALDLPWAEASFDRATLFHVGMNIADKAALFAGIARVLKPGGLFALWDVMRIGEGEIGYPTAWAAGSETSFVAPVSEYAAGLTGADLTLEATESRADVARDFFAKLRARLAAGGPPPLGLHLLMGSEAKVKVGNMAGAVEAGIIAPVLMLSRKPA